MNQLAARTALVLSGGGAYGAFAVGVLKTLFAGRSPATAYTPLSAEIFTGTSVGAFNAAIMAAHGANCLESALRLEEIWFTRLAERRGTCGNGVFRIRGNPEDWMTTACLRDPITMSRRFVEDAITLSAYAVFRTANFLASSNDPLEDRIMALLNLGSFVDSSPYHEILHALINENEIRQSPRRLKITTTDWVNGKAHYFSNEDFQNGRGILAIMASTAIPGVFPPVRIDHDIYVDGGVVENTPLKSAIDAGATNLHVVYLDPNPAVVRLKGEPNTLDTMLRVYFIMLATKIAEDVETARWINAALDAVASYQQNQTISSTALRDFIRAAAPLLTNSDDYKRVVIHRYFPDESLGGNLGMLDFGIDKVASIIQAGERVALLHDCEESGCVV